MNSTQDLLRRLPAVDRLLHHPILHALADSAPHDLLRESAQEAVDRLRRTILADPAAAARLDLSPAAVAASAAALAEEKLQFSLRPVINATGILLHTNLGRAPLSTSALRAVAAAARGYSNLEFDLKNGERGHRDSHVEALLCRLTGAEAATVVNNNAGAVLLALAALSQGKEAIVSRGELVEIGGAFRVPEVMAAGGVRLREIGTTNKTHLKDYRQAVGPETGLLLKIHTSNYRIVGFTATVAAAQMVELGREHGLPVMEDLGSGLLIDLSAYGLPQEPTVAEAVAAGIDVVTFSGDKLLGGPQAGLVVGRAAAVEKLRKHPLARALRIDKLTLAALEATLRHYLDPQEALQQIPVLRQLSTPPAELRRRCRRLARRLGTIVPDLSVEIVAATGQVGGGALPLTELPGYALALAPRTLSSETLARRLRLGTPPVVGRIHEDRLLIDPRTVLASEETLLVRALAAAVASPET